ncbi:polysaccharide biosynthesis C-terminal domain-containing protein [Fibrella sp. USSR17]
MTFAPAWSRLSAAVSSIWQRTAALWWAQGVSAATGVAYGKVTALFIAPATLGAFNLQLATTMLLHGIVVSPTIQTYMSALQQYDPTVARRFYIKMLAVIYAVSLAGTLLYAATHQWLAVGLLMWLVTCLQGMYLMNSSYFTAYGYINRLALIQALNPVINLLLLVALISTGQPVTTTALWGCAILLNGTLWLVSAYYRRRLASEPVVTSSVTVRPASIHFRRYATPLFAQAIFAWLINYVDKYIISLLLTQAAVGYYSAGYSMGSRLMILTGPFVTQLTMRLYALRRTSQSPAVATADLKKSLCFVWLLGGSAALVLFCFQEPIGNLFLSGTYRPSFAIVPLIATAYLFLSSTQLVESTFYAFEKTKYVLLNSIGTATVNVGLNFLLLPRFGTAGAAYAMVLSMVFQFMVALILYKRVLTS